MNWFKENAAAIQALSSAAALLVTVVLAWLTARYVRHTRDIATSSLEQVKQIREAARVIQQQNAHALGSLALRIRVALGQLSSDAPTHKELRAFSLLPEQDIADVQALARQVNDRATTSASGAVGPLRVIHAMLQKAKDTNELTGWLATAEEVTDWRTARQAAERMLQEVEVACHQVAAT